MERNEEKEKELVRKAMKESWTGSDYKAGLLLSKVEEGEFRIAWGEGFVEIFLPHRVQSHLFLEKEEDMIVEKTPVHSLPHYIPAVPDGDGWDLKPAVKKAVVKDWLNRQKGKFTIADCKEATGLCLNSVGYYFAVFMKKRMIERVRQGVYRKVA